jgi:p-cumate 2,3-dioxygenase beta subunit
MKPNAHVTRLDVEDFLFTEARLLDNWKLEEWLKLFLPEATYCVPSLDMPDLSPQDSLYLVMDDMKRLTSRVHQYSGRSMWVENPLSRTRRLISNTQILSSNGPEFEVTANFVVHRMRGGNIDSYIGRYEHVLVRTDAGLRFRARKAILDLESLKPHGKVSILL